MGRVLRARQKGLEDHVWFLDLKLIGGVEGTRLGKIGRKCLVSWKKVENT